MRSVPGTGPGGENITESPEGLSPLEKKNFIEKTIEEKSVNFRELFQKRLGQEKSDLSATGKEIDYESEAMHSIDQQYKVLKKLLAEESKTEKRENLAA